MTILKNNNKKNLKSIKREDDNTSIELIIDETGLFYGAIGLTTDLYFWKILEYLEVSKNTNNKWAFVCAEEPFIIFSDSYESIMEELKNREWYN